MAAGAHAARAEDLIRAEAIAGREGHEWSKQIIR
jgi:hypothetical protein